uniref:MATH domain-containing protein n=1 Tax=Panagrolaimus sp. PS1159 TaxID=55785 RepID=A0AC35G437_9BILA
MRWKISKDEIRSKLQHGETIYTEVDIKEFPAIQYALVIENEDEENKILVSLAFMMEKETKIRAKFKISLIPTNNFTCNAEQIFEESQERWGENICSYKEFFGPSNNYFIDDFIYVTMEAIVTFENEPKVYQF